MVVVAGVTFVDPIADDGTIPPGEIDMPVAPVTAQLKVLLAPEVRFEGATENELMIGLLGELTVTVTVAAAEPTSLVAVNV